MNDFDWIENLRREEDNFLPEPPEGLWDDIVDNLPPKKRQQHRLVPLWLRYSGVAACIALLFGTGVLFFNAPCPNGQLPQIAKRSIDESMNISVPAPQTSIPNVLTPPKVVRLANTERSPLHIAANDDSITHVEEPMQTEQVLLSSNKDEKKPNKDEMQNSRNRKQNNNNSLWLADCMTEKPKGRKKPSVSFYAGNIMAGNTLVQDGFIVTDTEPTEPSEGDNAYDDIFDLTQGMDVETKKHYRLPVRAGIRMSIPLTDALSVESGITYTLLSSSKESGSVDNYYHTEQTLHYVGIPLKLRYKLWNSKRFGVYVSGGGMVEKCVSGKAKTKFIVGGSRYSVEEQKVREKPLQLSATFAAGFEANIARNANLFIEPGASYYMNNHSSVDNVYKNKPFCFDLNIGIRMSFNK